MTESRRDILIGRLVDEEATAAEWNEFTLLSAADPSMWRELAELQRTQKLLSHGLELQIGAADRVEMPCIGHAAAEHIRRQGWRSHPALWAGWAVAAIVTVCWSLGLNGLVSSTRQNSGGNNASILPTASTPDEMLSTYLEEGRKAGVVVGEVPRKLLIESRPLEEGQGYQVYYIRQIVETRQVPELYEFQTTSDELGNPRAVRVIVRPAGSM